MGLAAPFLQVFAKGLGRAPAPVFGFCSNPPGDAGPARIFPPAHKPRLPQMCDGGMVRGALSGVKGACPAPAGCGMVGARKPLCRRSSGVEHALGKGGVVSSILTGGTTNPAEFSRLASLLLVRRMTVFARPNAPPRGPGCAAWPNPNRRTGINGRAFDRCSIVLPFPVVGRGHPGNLRWTDRGLFGYRRSGSQSDLGNVG